MGKGRVRPSRQRGQTGHEQRIHRRRCAQDHLAGVVDQAIALQEVLGVAERDVRVVDRARPRDHPDGHRQEGDQELKLHEPADAHAPIIASDPAAATRPSFWGWGALAALLAIGLKAALLAADVFPFNADESVVALMARHILQGARPAFFYGQAYMGSLDAVLVAVDAFDKGLDFADALHVASCGKARRFGTFDDKLVKRAKKLLTVEVVSLRSEQA